MDDNRPTVEDVLKYGKRQASVYIFRFASYVPEEQKEEIEQECFVRILEAYDRIDFERGWKSFIQRHALGCVLDYIRSSSGFEESELPQKEKDPETGQMIEVQDKKPYRLTMRISNTGRKSHDSPETDVAVDQVLGDHGIFETHPLFKKTQPRWDLIARMASQDNDIHLAGKIILGFTQTELSSMFKVSRERLTQRMHEFCDRLDAPELLHSRWVAQTIFAFGLCSDFHMPDKDLGFGWEYEAVDLWSTENNYIEMINPQMAFEFDWN